MSTVIAQEVTNVITADKPYDVVWDCADNATGYQLEKAVGEGLFNLLTETTECSVEDIAPDLQVMRYRVRAYRTWEGGAREWSEYSEPSDRNVALLRPTVPGKPNVVQE